MFTFKQYLHEIEKLITEAPVTGGKSSSLPLRLRAIERKDARLAQGIANLPSSAPPPSLTTNISPAAIKSEKQSILATNRANRQADIAAQRRAGINTQVGSGLIRSLIGSSGTGRKPGSGILGALQSYDRSRAEKGVRFDTTPTMTAGLANLALNASTPTNDPSSFTNRTLSNIGGLFRQGRVGVDMFKKDIGAANQAISGLFKPELPKVPLATAAETSLRSKLISGTVPAQAVGIQTQNTSPAESPEAIRARMQGNFTSGLSPTAQNKISSMKKFGWL